MAITYNPIGDNELGDGSDEQGGTPPAFASEPADIPTTDTDPDIWINDIAVGEGRPEPGDPSFNEAKFRTHCHPTHILKADPIVYPGQANAGHMHQFFGNHSADHNSTYTSLRSGGKSSCDGGPLNRSAYWHPAIYQILPSGVHAVKIPDRYSIYYPAFGGIGADLTRIPRGFRYVGGYNTAWNDTMPADQRAAMEAANAAAGSTRYQERSTYQDGWGGWTCVDTGVKEPYLKGPNGEDMLQNCPATSQIKFDLRAPRCWNGQDLTSSDGRQHVLYEIHSNSTGQATCHQGAYRLPDFQVTGILSHNGPDDYLNWYLSSDRMLAADTPGDPASRSLCRQLGPYFCNGETMHFDWFGAWDYGTEASPGVMLKWQNHCTGVKISDTMPADPGDCRDGEISISEKLISGNVASPDPTLSNDPVTPFTARTSLAKTLQYYPVPDGTIGTFTLTHRNGDAL
jgi:hypothetical protein